MKTKILVLVLAALFPVTGLLHAQNDTDTNSVLTQMHRLADNLKYQQGTINLRDGLATLTVPKDFYYLGPDDTETVLVKLWHNPPLSTKPLGMLIPAGMTPLDTNCWVVTIEYDDDGYVKDNDASKINYDDLLKTMQKAVADNNVEREKLGYATVQLVGWAAPPRYDAVMHKLYWAKDLKFEGRRHDTLNYNIRMLGRKGVLELNAIASMKSFPEIDAQTTNILAMVDYKEGNRYADFDPKTDKVAKYGLTALVAGGALAAAAKFGLLKVLWVGLIAAKKFVIIGVAALIAFFKKMFKRNNS